MNVEDRRTQVAGGTHGSGHGIGDVVELEIEKQRFTAGHGADSVGTLGREELLAELQAADPSAQGLGQHLRSREIGGIDPDIELRACVAIHHDGCDSRATARGHAQSIGVILYINSPLRFHAGQDAMV